jgi:flagella basal body P-ring formation protein FlgA
MIETSNWLAEILIDKNWRIKFLVAVTVLWQFPFLLAVTWWVCSPGSVAHEGNELVIVATKNIRARDQIHRDAVRLERRDRIYCGGTVCEALTSIHQAVGRKTKYDVLCGQPISRYDIGNPPTDEHIGRVICTTRSVKKGIVLSPSDVQPGWRIYAKGAPVSAIYKLSDAVGRKTKTDLSFDCVLKEEYLEH